MSTERLEWDRHVAETVEVFEERFGLREANKRFERHAAGSASMVDAARILLDDFSDIPFLDNIVGVEHYQLRAFLRAGSGDVCLATCGNVAGYLEYNRDLLGLGSPRFIDVEPGPHPPVAVSKAAMEDSTLGELSRFARHAGGVLIEPYMSIGATWDLAIGLEAEAGVPAKVLGPPPPVTAFANNKAHLTAFANALVSPLLGREATVPTRVSESIEGVAASLIDLSKIAPQVAMKMPRCASAMGNYLFEGEAADALDRADMDSVIGLLARVLDEKRWDGVESVLSVAWLDTWCSPSTQCWVPPLGAGRPHVDGVYEQLLIGPEKVFLGSVPAQLRADHVDWMTRVSQLVIEGYQRLGYVGRCSFDFIIHDDTPYLVECNGRWGGTSIPMQLMDRVFGAPRPSYRARDYVSESLRGMRFQDLLGLLGDSLYDARTGRGRFIVYNIGCLEPFGKFDVIALGQSQEDAAHYLEEELPRLLGEGPEQGAHG